MAPSSPSRQVWMWSFPTVVLLLSLVWYKRKRNTHRTDPGGTPGTPLKAVDDQVQQVTGQQEPESKHEPDLTEGISKVQSQVPQYEDSEEVLKPEQNAVCQLEDPSTTSKVFVEEETIVKGDIVGVDCAKESVEEVVAAKPEPEAAEQEFSHSSLQEDSSDPSQSVTSLEESQKEGSVSSDEMKEAPRDMASPIGSHQEPKKEGDKVDALEGKLASLALDSTEAQRRGAERDSANHSPVDAMLASPSMSSYSDEHSEGSSDSGKGCSDVASPPSRTPVGSGSLAGDGDSAVEGSTSLSVYEFLLPQLLVGRLIGRHGQFVHEIKAKTNANIFIKKHPETQKQKVCAIEGTQMDIDNALAMIRDRFPLRKYPSVTLEQVSFLPAPTLVPDFCQLHLVEGVNNEVMISSLVSPAHMFLQQPYHPSYQFLVKLNHMMNSVYTQVEAPPLPDPIEAGNICVAPAVDGWYRAQVVSTDEESQTSDIKFVDYGGYMTVNNSVLRQIRQDFMTLPFQATECYLANVKPTAVPGECGEWSLDALRIVEELTRGQMLLAQVYDYAADNVPLIYLYSSVNSQLVLVNQELVARGMAELDETLCPASSSEAASLVAAAAAAAEVAAVGFTPSMSTSAAGSDSSEQGIDDRKSSVVSSSQANTPEVTAN